MQDYCEQHDMPRAWCEHGVAERRAAISKTGVVLISPKNMAHLEGCSHKGEDPDYSKWGAIVGVSDAWQRIGNGEHVQANAGDRRDRVATARCRDCEARA